MRKIKIKELRTMADKDDYIGSHIEKYDKKSVKIIIHTMPSYYGNAKIDYDDFTSLMWDIDMETKIITYCCYGKYEGYKVVCWKVN